MKRSRLYEEHVKRGATFIEQAAETWGLLMISAPRAPELGPAAFGAIPSPLKPLSFVPVDIDGHASILIRTEETGDTDVEILLPADGLKAAWDRCWSHDEPFGLRPFGAHALESLRVEAGLPKAGPDLNENIFPPEANLKGKPFSLTKCF